MTGTLDDVLLRCAAGEVPPNLALMQAILLATAPGEIDAALTRRIDPEGRLEHLAALWQHGRDRTWRTVKGVAATVDHQTADVTADAALVRLAASFDALAETAPEAGVALYALGDPELFARATAEVVEKLETWGFLSRDRDALEIGCGSGRFIGALAPKLRSLAGVDISGGMIAEARRRCCGLSNVRLEQTDGRGLGLFPDRAFDLVLAIDVFPYLTAGDGDLAVLHMIEAARVLRPGGDLVILNYSYRGDHARDRADLAALASRTGFEVVRSAEGDFALWDGATFHLRRSQ